MTICVDGLGRITHSETTITHTWAFEVQVDSQDWRATVQGSSPIHPEDPSVVGQLRYYAEHAPDARFRITHTERTTQTRRKVTDAVPGLISEPSDTPDHTEEKA